MADQQPSAAPSEAREVYVVDGVEYTVHPLAMFFPLIEGPPFDEFVEDVHRRGMSQPVLRRGKEIIDGRNRLRAASVRASPWSGRSCRSASIPRPPSCPRTFITVR